MDWKWTANKLRESIRQPSERKIGLEIERIGLWSDGRSFNYYGGVDDAGNHRPGASKLLPELAEYFGWSVIRNSVGDALGLQSDFGKVSLEPGSQLELAANPDKNIHDLVKKIESFEIPVSEITKKYGLTWVCIGVNPVTPVECMDVIPSKRYHIMTDYLQHRGRLGTSMMRLSTSVQINLDYTSEPEAIDMLRTALWLTPLSYALFANSPIANRTDTSFLSYRGKIWQHTDSDRTGLLPEAFEPGFDFDAYAQLAWRRPLMFVADEAGNHQPTEGKSLEQLSQLGVAPANESNLLTTLQQLFFEARIKPGYVEIRSVDGQCPHERYAATAFFTGLLYSKKGRGIVREIFGSLSMEQLQLLFDRSLIQGLAANEAGVHLGGNAPAIVAAAREGLLERGFGEEQYLEPLNDIITSGQNPAQRRLQLYKDKWQGDPATLLEIAGRG